VLNHIILFTFINDLNGLLVKIDMVFIRLVILRIHY